MRESYDRALGETTAIMLLIPKSAGVLANDKECRVIRSILYRYKMLTMGGLYRNWTHDQWSICFVQPRVGLPPSLFENRSRRRLPCALEPSYPPSASESLQSGKWELDSKY